MILEGTYPAGTFSFNSQQDVYGVLQGAGPQTIFDFSTAPSSLPGGEIPKCLVLHGAAKLRNCTVIGAGTWSVPVWLEGCTGAEVVGVHATGSGYILIVDHLGFNNRFFQCRAVDTNGIPGYAYAMGSFGSTHLRVAQCYGHAMRHGFTMGAGANLTGVTYDCEVKDCTLIGDIIFGADMHGPTQRSRYVQCKIENGVNVGGSENLVKDCDISVLTLPGSEVGVNFANLADLNHTISGCTIQGNCPTLTLGAIYWDRAGDPGPRSGTFNFENNTIQVIGRFCYLRNHWEISANAVFSGTVEKPSYYSSTADGLLQSLTVPTRWTQVRAENLRLRGGNFAPGAYINDFRETNVQWSA